MFGLKADTVLGSWWKQWAGYTLSWTSSEGSPGLLGKANLILSPQSLSSRLAYLAVVQAQGPGLPLGPRPLPPKSPQSRETPSHKEHYSLLIRLPLETSIPMQKACLLPDQTGERCHPRTPTDCPGTASVARSGLCPFPRDTGTLYTSPCWRSCWKQWRNSSVVLQRH